MPDLTARHAQIPEAVAARYRRALSRMPGWVAEDLVSHLTLALVQAWRRPAHLLGGGPVQQVRAAQYLNVVSADGNMANKMAHRCRFWSPVKGPKGHWRNLSEAGDLRKDGANLECFRRSMNEIAALWRRHRAVRDA